jgi:hypothetical protein
MKGRESDPSPVFVFGSDWSDDEDADVYVKSKKASSANLNSNLPRHSMSNSNLPYRPTCTDRFLDAITGCLTPFALCFMGKSPTNKRSKEHSNRVIMDPSLLRIIDERKKEGEAVMMRGRGPTSSPVFN